MSFVLVAMRTIHGTLKRLLCALYYRYRTCCVVHAGRWCAPSCVDADKTWSITGALGVMAAALPARAGLRYLLTAVRQALKDRSSGCDKPGLFQKVARHRGEFELVRRGLFMDACVGPVEGSNPPSCTRSGTFSYVPRTCTNLVLYVLAGW